ncbi:MAG: biopolymer transporter ExbD [Oceanicaulis sp.]
MALSRTRKRRKASITSLIDVIFLLLLFFMLASTFTDRAEIELTSAPPGPGGGESDAPVLRLMVGQDSLTLDGAPVTLQTLAATVSRIGEPGAVLAVDLAPEADTERLISVLLALESVEGVQIRVVEAAP